MRRATQLRLLILAAKIRVSREETTDVLVNGPPNHEGLYDALGGIEGRLRMVEEELIRLARRG